MQAKEKVTLANKISRYAHKCIWNTFYEIIAFKDLPWVM